MTLRIDFTPKEEAWINGQASSLGVSPDEVVRRIVDQQVPATATERPATNDVANGISAENAAAIAYLDARIKAEATTDPEELRRRREEYEEFTRNLNANRAATGERLLFP